MQGECNPETCTQMTATEQWIFLCAAHKTPKEVSHYLSPDARKPVFQVSNQSDTNWVEQLQKITSGLKFWIQEEEGLCCISSKNKGADQLRGQGTVEMSLFFSHMLKAGFVMTLIPIPQFKNSHVLRN